MFCSCKTVDTDMECIESDQEKGNIFKLFSVFSRLRLPWTHALFQNE